MTNDLTGLLHEGDKVLEVFRQYTEESYKQGRVLKLTKTRVTIQYLRDGSTYTQEFTLKTGQLYPRSDSYSYRHIEVMTPENQDRFNVWIERRRLEYSIAKSREVLTDGHLGINKLTMTQLRALDTAFADVARLVQESRK